MRRALAALALLFAVVGALLTAPADARGSAATELERLRDDYDEVLAEEAHLLVAFEDSVRRKGELDLRVVELDGRVAAGQAELNEAEDRLLATEARARVATRQLRRATRDLARSKDRMQDRAVAAYTGTGGQGQLTGMILSAKNIQEVQVAGSYAAAVLDDQRQEIDRHAELKALIDDRAASATQAEQEAAAVREALAARQTELEAAQEQLRVAQENVATEVRQQEMLLAQVRERKATTEKRIVALQLESDSIGMTLRQRQTGQPLTVSGTGVFANPLPGATVGSPFGPRVHPIFGTTRMHNGLDMGGAMGAPILAAGAGEVVFAGERGGYGNAVVIDHGGQLATLYAHQSRMAVTPGQMVEQGQIIGYVGSTGFSTGPHLHFEVRANGTPVDPIPFFER